MLEGGAGLMHALSFVFSHLGRFGGTILYVPLSLISVSGAPNVSPEESYMRELYRGHT